MADTKITALPAITTVQPATLLVVVDDPSGTPINKKASVSQLQLGLRPVVQPFALTGVQSDIALTPGAAVLRCANATTLGITGFGAANAVDGQELTVLSVGAGQVDLYHSDGTSLLANRLLNAATSLVTSLAAGLGRAVYRYDATSARWRLVLHHQGAPLPYTPTWAGSGGTPTVGNGSLIGTYLLRDRQVDASIQLSLGSTSTLGAGYWTFGLPVAAAGVGTLPSAAGFVTTGGGTNHPLVGVVAGAGIISILTASEANLGAGSPAGMITGDLMRVSIAGYPIN